MSETTFDVKRATDILDQARNMGMYPSPLPDSDEVRIQEAERIIALARQAQVVADEVGKDKVPNYDAIIDIISLADADGGTLSAQIGNNGYGEGEAAELRPETQAGEATDSESPTDAPSPPPELDPTPEQQPQQVDVNESFTGRWCDEDGCVWVVDQDLGDELEVHMDGDAEKTTVPRDFLKRKIDDPAPPQEIKPKPEEETSTSSQESQDPQPSSSSDQSSPASGTVTPKKPSGSESAQEQQQPSQSSSSGSGFSGDGAYEDLLARVQADYDSAGLPIPGDVASLPEMPQDLTANEAENRRLHSAFNSCAGRVRYLLGLERQTKIGCQRLQKEAMKGPMRRARAKLGTKATATEVTMLAEEDDVATRWREYVEMHADREAAYKDLFDIYSTNVEVLSRDFTMSGREMGGRS